MTDWLIKRWARIRDKGQLRYVALTSLLLSLAQILGRFIGAYWSNAGVWQESHMEELVLHAIFVLLITPVLAVMFWYLEEAWYQKALKRKAKR
ncbi:hypothetical protein [Enterovibrio nigricans]|uniref:Uncharacterized protein n=1 Tax=Enterovibrio nigricans DSM 22720 TaxID=1121868 RepID=A0A1T4W242_9GAMM|nr:hypothetical protein [Enterovibrio nigricans]PKF49001.1 hypothetical protein AT251_22060 [Enterovibrio nigricans]SKA71313.1 hypothetical protein SAMN02745132_04674 [Enterovibrio nigricans DSM 22720]